MMFKNKWTYLGLFIVVIFVIVAVFAPFIAPHDPMEIDLPQALNTPSLENIMGQDQNGSDIFSRIVHGARISLFTGLTVVFISSVVGIFLGLISGFYGGLIDTVLMRIVDVLLAFPGLLLAIAIVAVMGPQILNVVIALSVLGWVSFARLVRGQVLAVKEREFVYAARTSGQSDLRVMFMHILPNIMSPVIVQATFSIAGVIIAESSLSFLGLGAPPGTPSWGLMLSEGTKELLDAPHVSIFPGAAIMLLVIAFNFIGDGLRDLLDPKTEKK
ncbi:MAG: ABC transporter permease [Deltaproteobacteria bacterium]|nr:ABC transporter permease [Deltaproteobacteria bacterium]